MIAHERLLLHQAIDNMSIPQIKILTEFLFAFNVLPQNNIDKWDDISDEEYEECIKNLNEIENGEYTTLEQIRKTHRNTIGKEVLV